MRLKSHQQFLFRIEMFNGTDHCIQLCGVMCIIVNINFAIGKGMFGIASFNAFEACNTIFKRFKIDPKTVEQCYGSSGIFYIMNAGNFPYEIFGFCVRRVKIKINLIPFFTDVIRIKICHFVHGVGFRLSSDVNSFSDKQMLLLRN